ncbi:hypothetical protein [Hymenobacter sp. BT730]|uniref:hypothetical protein n=1 Tax=Hymenobacter sp. BT730 TaxID=3063332 RepID=UPI0026DF71E0|nr:hypothetical protein [Hymenobacter sp. BT730]
MKIVFKANEAGYQYFENMERNARLTIYFYGPISLTILLIATWAKVGDSPYRGYCYALDVLVVGWGYYYTGVIRAGKFMNRVISELSLQDDFVCFKTYPWLCMNAQSNSCALTEIMLTKKQILNTDLYEFTLGDKHYYIKGASLQHENELLYLLGI